MMIVMRVGDEERLILPAKPIMMGTDAKLADSGEMGACLTVGNTGTGTPMRPRFDVYLTVADLEMILDFVPSYRWRHSNEKPPE